MLTHHIKLEMWNPKRRDLPAAVSYREEQPSCWTNDGNRRFEFRNREQAINAMVEECCTGITYTVRDWQISVISVDEDGGHFEEARVSKRGTVYESVISTNKNPTKCGRCGGENFICLQCDNQVQ